MIVYFFLLGYALTDDFINISNCLVSTKYNPQFPLCCKGVVTLSRVTEDRMQYAAGRLIWRTHKKALISIFLS